MAVEFSANEFSNLLAVCSTVRQSVVHGSLQVRGELHDVIGGETTGNL